MAVYTRISAPELMPLLARFGLQVEGVLQEVAEGIENSTYFFRASRQHDCERILSHYVLTILENTPVPQMQFSAALCCHLADQGLPVPAPLRDSSGQCTFLLAGKYALIFPKAEGQHPPQASEQHCQILGQYMARAHRSDDKFQWQLNNSRGLPWLSTGAEALLESIDKEEMSLINHQLESYQHLTQVANLPVGPIHGDLFTDNTLFLGDQLSAVIDFYNACTDWLLLDVAIAVNDWCTKPGEVALDPSLATAFTSSYHRVRPFTNAERDHWQAILCLAATRFWVSRLLGVHRPELLGGEVKTKNPNDYRDRLLQRLQSVPELIGC